MELQLAPADPGHVEQVVDQVGLHLDVSPDRGQILAHVEGQAGPHLEEGDRRHHGGQRGSQLVAQGGEELVLGPAGLVGLRLGLPQVLLGPLPLGDVASDGREPDDTAGAIPDRRVRHRDVDRPAIARDPHRLGVPHRLTPKQPGLDRGLLTLAARRQEEGDRAAHHFRHGVAEEAFGAGVPRVDIAAEILADDRIVGRLDDRRQRRLGFIGPLPLGDVADVALDDHADRRHDRRC